jgi:hypothetical protein
MVSDVEVIVVKAASGEVSLECGGWAMVAFGATPEPATLKDGLDEPTLIGKRYTDEAEGVEVLVTKGGTGTLCLDGTPLAIKDAKPLPSSD